MIEVNNKSNLVCSYDLNTQQNPIVYDVQESTLDKEFLEEVKTHIEQDAQEIVDIFYGNGTNKTIKNVSIKKAGDETHYGGKVALFLEIDLGNSETIKIVYKPRSIGADYILELTLANHSKLQEYEPRAMLPKENYGYESHVEGEPLKDLYGISEKNQPPTLKELMYKDGTKHFYLVLVLWQLGIEDTHAGNFIYNDKTDTLHFVDAECYDTKTSDALSGFSQEFELYEIEDVCKENNKQLRKEPTRLVFCPTDDYQDYYTSTLKEFTVSFYEEGLEFKFTQSSSGYMDDEERDRLFCERHNAQFLYFLHVNEHFRGKEMDIKNGEISAKDIRYKLVELIGEDGVTILENSFKDVKLFRDTSKLGEIPSFHYDFEKKEVTVDYNKEKIAINNSFDGFEALLASRGFANRGNFQLEIGSKEESEAEGSIFDPFASTREETKDEGSTFDPFASTREETKDEGSIFDPFASTREETKDEGSIFDPFASTREETKDEGSV